MKMKMKLNPETVAEALAATRACASYDADNDPNTSWFWMYRPNGGLKEELEDEIRTHTTWVDEYTKRAEGEDEYMQVGRFGADWLELCPDLAKRYRANLNKAAAHQRKLDRAQKTLDELLRKMAEMEREVAA